MNRLAKLVPILATFLVGAEARAAFEAGSLSATYDAATDSTRINYLLSYTPLGGNPLSRDFLTIYDVYDPATTTFSAAGSQAGGNIAVAVASVGLTPGGFPPPPDSPTLNNVIFIFTGAPTTFPIAFPVGFTLSGNFTGTPRIGVTSTSNIDVGVSPIRQAAIPTQVVPPASVPEPASMAMVGLGLAGVGVLARRRR